MLEVAGYYKHDHHTSELPKAIKLMFNDWIHQDNNWLYLINYWNTNVREGKKIDIPSTPEDIRKRIPDYSKI